MYVYSYMYSVYPNSSCTSSAYVYHEIVTELYLEFLLQINSKIDGVFIPNTIEQDDRVRCSNRRGLLQPPTPRLSTRVLIKRLRCPARSCSCNPAAGCACICRCIASTPQTPVNKHTALRPLIEWRINHEAIRLNYL